MYEFIYFKVYKSQRARDSGDNFFVKDCDFWGFWSNWSPCSEECGRGERSRTRACINGITGQGACSGASVITEFCEQVVSLTLSQNINFCYMLTLICRLISLYLYIRIALSWATGQCGANVE